MESRVGEHQTPAWRRNNPALEWSCDQALKERGDWDELITGVSDRLQLRRSHAPCHTHTDTGKEERQETTQTQNTNPTVILVQANIDIWEFKKDMKLYISSVN